ncbi:nucleotidyltransferase family protein [Trichlorobacter lovleyi]|uniref:nucleotidyltransferase family protein n=1 Tax=Trichlorobacter lovleyi TaxID=313985 RepID=UPI00223F4566|nr:nucleotidyltransferase family protein [Trichlorobacter lovleyi]QOX80471.1 nucleotidyltransferase family protein [Trichlorobacter lovleyi]
MKRTVAAVLLAAGKSSRMGSCKPLLPLGDGTVISRCLDTLQRGGVNEVVVVVSLQGEAVARAARDHGVRCVVNPDEGGDMASSIRVGRDSITPETSGIIVALCDYPLVLPDTVTALIDQHLLHPESIITPTCGGRRGHPLLLPRLMLEELSEGNTLRDLLQKDAARIRDLPLEDSGVLIDMDTPDDYRAVCALLP